MNVLAKISKLPVHVQQSAADERGLLDLRMHYDQFESALSALLPLEANARTLLLKEQATVRRRLLRAEMRAIGAPRLSLDILGTRASNTLPSLAAFHLDRNSVWIQNGQMGWSERVPSGRDWGRVSDTDISASSVLARAVGWSNSSAHIAIFSGVLPRQTRERIQRYRALCDDGMYIIAEVKWHTVAMDPDPLLVALDGDVFWLVDKFDVTPLEQLVVDEPGALSI